ncbi:ComF family protein [Pseudomonas segetis]|uniref:ComF family protein n=1 Tax=Pseudomonas segetis TaxID=298908 RepID=A0A239JGU1_9PSED|nr:ComF family protein [Pseudomonas segetis]SNT04648.1 comF family protein [Pseudomonas segetis]
MAIWQRLKHQLETLQPCLKCLLCDETTESKRLPICTDCERELPWLRAHCSVCALPMHGAEWICGECQKNPPSFDKVVAPWSYSFPVQGMINRFKHQAQWPLGRLLGDLLSDHMLHSFADGLVRPDLLLPVPLTKQRQRQRGFNQAQMLANSLGKALHIPLLSRGLSRIIDTPAQQGLDAVTRKKNLRNAFFVAPEVELQGRHLALVDDVLTTGATAQTLSKLLLKAGAARVDVYCLARTPKPGTQLDL